METFFLIIQTCFAIGGGGVGLFVREPQRAVFGFLMVFLSVASVMIAQQSPWILCLILILGFGVITPWIYIKGVQRFNKEPTQPLDTHLGISRILLLLVSAYFLLSILPLWPSLLSDIQKSTAANNHPSLSLWAVYLGAIFLVSVTGLLPFIIRQRSRS
mgnify:CR=1 FL=1